MTPEEQIYKALESLEYTLHPAGANRLTLDVPDDDDGEADEALADIRDALDGIPGVTVDYTGNGNTDDTGHNTSGVFVRWED